MSVNSKFRNTVYRYDGEFCSFSMAESDLEVNHAMRDFLPSWAHSSPSREASCDRVVGEATSRPLTPGRDPFFRQITPNRTSRDSSAESESLLRFNLGSMDLPLSPSRPKSPWGHFDPYDSIEDQDKDYVGFATLPNQVHKKSVKRGFDFTLMVAGESGLGKSTLVNSLFLTDLYKDRRLFSAEERITQTVEITRYTVDIEEKGVKLRLTVVDTPGFGDAVNNKECWRPVVDYIEEQFEQYFRDESGLNRKNIQDNRVHCCLYFISPFSHGLRPIDVEFMKALHEKVNIVPVLAKADSLTPYEMRKKKIKIREEMEQHGIKIYQFPDCDSDSDEDFRQHDQELKGRVPFAIIGSNMVVESMGRQVRGRLYPWGIVEVEDPAHSDFLMLRDLLVRTHMQDLKDITRERHYENFRVQCIQNMTRMAARERRRIPTQDNRADFPIPLTSCSTDSNAERLVWEKDQELGWMQEGPHRIPRQKEAR